MPVPNPLLAASAVGVAAHLLFFKKLEHHVVHRRYVAFRRHVAASAGSFALGVYMSQSPILNEKPGVHISWVSAISFSLQLHACFLLGLYASLLTYRLFFHPLKKFPGPLSARISTFWLTSYNYNDVWRDVASLHEQYGPFVRIAPGELSVRDPKAVAALHGPKSKCDEAPFYHVIKPTTSLHMLPDPDIHDDFDDRTLREYNQRASAYRSVLLDRIHATKGEPMDMARWFRFYVCEVIGHLAPGAIFNILQTSDNHWAIDAFGSGLLPSVHDICYRPIVHTLVAGMTSILYELVKHPEHIDRLRQELAPLVQDSLLDPSPDELEHLEHLNAVINETLRLHPPVHTTIWCVTPPGGVRFGPPGGVRLGHVHIPGGTIVTYPQYAVSRSKSAVPLDAFIPERWYRFPWMAVYKNTFSPFVMGVYPWAGDNKRLALMDIRQVISRLVWTFDVAFAPGEDGGSFEGVALDTFMVAYGPLILTLKARQGVQL
ncbi:cytochrome P450 [Trichoderma longibrachiatum ATCC 18648]|uniref:Cytochrome P450 n=1 Tax=Trichoderma longibrachiatum ATCC 18648 TaxID=983965 RepID=A0A2T4BWD5_TRILO|nr:cytochrome P450 [Trichoderma longibrachiatum ATCC 18648]